MVDPKLIDVTHQFDGHITLDPTDEEHELLMAGATVFPDRFRINRGSEWDDRIEAHKKHSSSADFYSSRMTHQGSSHECVWHSATQLFEVAFNRQYGGLEHAIWFSPVAGYTRATGGRQYGGSNVRHSLEIMMNEGMIPEHDGPAGNNAQYERFNKCTVHQTSGRSEDHWPTKGWITPSRLPDGWQELAKHFRVLEAYTIPDREAHASALLHGWAVSNGRNGHSIPHMVLVKDGSRYLSKYKDSYNRWLYDSESLWGGGFCVRSVTMSDLYC